MKKLFIVFIPLFSLITVASLELKANAVESSSNSEETTNESLIEENNDDLLYTAFYQKHKGEIITDINLCYTIDDYLIDNHLLKQNPNISVDDYVNIPDRIIDKDNAYGYKNDVIKIDNNEFYTFQLAVDNEGLYEIYFDYYFLTTSILTTEATMKVNNEYQYYEARQLVFGADWKPETQDFKVDRYGNEIVPSSTRMTEWYNEKALQDGSLLHPNALMIKLNAGDNYITIGIKTGCILIGNIYLRSPKELSNYNDYLKTVENQVKTNELIKIPAEYLYTKSDISIRQYSSRDVSMNRYDSIDRLLNCIYHDSFRKGNQSISYEVDVPNDGLYNLSFKYYQTGLIDLPCQRTIYINDEIPYKELENYNFYYAKNWVNESLHNDDGLLYVYLKKGINKITIKVSLDFYRYIIEEIERIMDEMTDISLQIKYLNNGQEDQYRNWNVSEYLPNLKSELERWSKEITDLVEYGNTLSTNRKGSSSFANLKLAIKKLDKLADDPDSVPNELNNFTDGTSSASQLLGNTVSSLRDNPMCLEMIYLGSENTKIPRAKANFFLRLWEGIKRFFLSFFNDEYSIESADEDEIEIWVNRSRQYIEIMQQLADEAGFKVRFSIMPDESKLVLANSAGNLPDIAMGVSNWIPYDLAIRGITVNLRQFAGYEEVVSKMSKGTIIPYAYDEGVYGLPETQDFWVLFARTDLLANMNLSIPSTWSDLVKALPKLQSMGCNFYSPISAYTGLKPFVATLPLFYQYGGSLYSEDGMSTTLDNENNIEALKFMTNLFTIYNVPEEVPNFYNSFRQGVLPLGIANSGTYIQLTVAAPEIQGNWEIYPHLGTKTSDGTIVRYASSNSQGLTIFESSNKKEACWDYIKWWLSTETQERYIQTLYSVYGLEYLFFTSNNEAFELIPIPTSHKEVIKEQLNWAAEASRIPAAYMVERSISDAYSKIVFNGENPRIALDDATIDSNREMIRKMEEFGFMKEGQKVKDYKVPTIYNIDDWLTELR